MLLIDNMRRSTRYLRRERPVIVAECAAARGIRAFLSEKAGKSSRCSDEEQVSVGSEGRKRYTVCRVLPSRFVSHSTDPASKKLTITSLVDFNYLYHT
jgi:hypothetical protein